jgi:phosphotransferase system enzyme I (PtsP)
MVIAEMAELGAFTGEGAALRAPHKRPAASRRRRRRKARPPGMSGCTSRASWSPTRSPTIPTGTAAPAGAVERLRGHVDHLLTTAEAGGTREQREVLEAYRMFANSRGWMRRMEEDIARGLSAEAAVEKEQSAARARMARCPTPICATGCTTLTICRTGCCALLTGQGPDTGADAARPDPGGAQHRARANCWITGGG